MTLTPAALAQQAVIPGWYADPMAPGQARWWSGESWTHHVQPLPTAVSPTAAEPWSAINLLVPRQRGMAVRAMVWGIVAVVIDPLLAPSILAIVYGALALRRSRQLVAQGYPAGGRRRAIAGIALGIFGAVFTLFCIGVFLRNIGTLP